ncbi:DUF1284 domain-containing protein [Niallia nealsonii]|uniref:DUF1284 domain-containing protein n=1 Tax=Niallia nealsonii TaxID=115979 RepID=A0A2N0Z543_9BACI|nr:DUF1284 domain-containing protein [Niallia nealsonii]PKG24609.1 DUF1284 domain-containing protein [Niallia nealsonii]
MKRKVVLRGHHLLCVHGFQGMGYSPIFVNKMEETVASIRDEQVNFPIKVVDELDETCLFCPHSREGICNAPKANEFVQELDRKVLTHLQIEKNQLYLKEELVSLVAEKVNPDDLDFLCEGCSWLSYGVCKEGIKTLQEKRKLS